VAVMPIIRCEIAVHGRGGIRHGCEIAAWRRKIAAYAGMWHGEAVSAAKGSVSTAAEAGVAASTKMTATAATAMWCGHRSGRHCSHAKGHAGRYGDKLLTHRVFSNSKKQVVVGTTYSLAGSCITPAAGIAGKTN
jgi:hypothetical protein